MNYFIDSENSPSQLVKINKNEHFDYNCITFIGQNILMAANFDEISVYEFHEGIMKKISSIGTQSATITLLVFMKNLNQFVTAGVDNMIRLWSPMGNTFLQKQLFKGGHTNFVYCIIINKPENLIISGSADKSIKFWKLMNQWMCCCTLKKHSDRVLGISLNETENKLVSCSSREIIISGSIENDRWIMLQRIQVKNYGLSVCFIDDNVIIYQSFNQNKMEVLSLNEKNQFYQKSNEILLNEGFSYQLQIFTPIFNKQKNLLLHKQNDQLYLIRRIGKESFTVEQSIKLETVQIAVTINADWEYLITLDSNIMMLEIWKLT